ncbi:hypothetical protein Tco_0766123 [Tanacetum coccineum]
MDRHLKSMGTLATLQEGNKCSEKTNAKADVFRHQHIDEMLEFDYSNYEWNTLRFQDFKKVNEYTSALFRICRTLRFCGQTVTEADMLEKTFSTFHASNINLQQQYRLQNFKRYSDLNVNLLVAEENNEFKRGRGNPRGRGRGHYGHNRFPNRNYTYHRGGYNGHGRRRGRGRGQRNNTYHAPQVNDFNQKNNEVGNSQNHEGSFFRCGSANHWSKACLTPSHVCELYQSSRKGKEKEVNHVDQFDNTNTELIASDFFNNSEV